MTIKFRNKFKRDKKRIAKLEDKAMRRYIHQNDIYWYAVLRILEKGEYNELLDLYNKYGIKYYGEGCG